MLVAVIVASDKHSSVSSKHRAVWRRFDGTSGDIGNSTQNTPERSSTDRTMFLIAAIAVGAAAIHGASGQMQRATPLITSGTSRFGPFIEGACTDTTGNLFAVNYGNAKNAIGKVTSSGVQSLYYTGAAGSQFNGIRIDRAGNMFLADYGLKRVVRLPAGSTTAEVACDLSAAIQGIPNDIALADNGDMYASGQTYSSNTKVGDGQLWLCKSGVVRATLLDGQLGRTNGVEVVGTSLYVSEAYNGGTTAMKIWRYTINPSTGTVSGKTLFADFQALDGTAAIDVDGMRADVNGNLYVTRNGGQTVTVLSPNGVIAKKIQLSFTNPSNLEFGGPKGMTLYVVGNCGINPAYGTGVGCVDTFETGVQGRLNKMLTASTATTGSNTGTVTQSSGTQSGGSSAGSMTRNSYNAPLILDRESEEGAQEEEEGPGDAVTINTYT